MKSACPADWQVDRFDGGDYFLHAIEDRAFLGNGTESGDVAVAAEGVLADEVAAVRDCFHVDHPARPLRAVGAGKLAEGTFDLHDAGGNLPFDDHVGIGWDQEVVAPGSTRGETE